MKYVDGDNTADRVYCYEKRLNHPVDPEHLPFPRDSGTVNRRLCGKHISNIILDGQERLLLLLLHDAIYAIG